MGIVFLPGAMTGMIIAGAEPLDAVRLQVVIMYMLLTAVAVTATLIGLGVVGRLFTEHQQLRRVETAAEQRGWPKKGRGGRRAPRPASFARSRGAVIISPSVQR